MRVEVLIAATTAAADGVVTAGYGGVRVDCVGLGTAESIPVEIPNTTSPADGTDAHWEAMYIDGSAVAFTYQSENTIYLNGPGKYRFNKGTTAGAVAIIAYHPGPGHRG